MAYLKVPSQYLPLKPEELHSECQSQQPLARPRLETHTSRIDVVLLRDANVRARAGSK